MMFLFTVIIFVVTLQPEIRKQYMQFHRFTVLIIMIFGAIFISFSSIASSPFKHFVTASDTNDYKVLYLFKNAEDHPKVLRWTVFPAYNDNDGVMAGLVPVSYTHLDVYKRQMSGAFVPILLSICPNDDPPSS